MSSPPRADCPRRAASLDYNCVPSGLVTAPIGGVAIGRYGSTKPRSHPCLRRQGAVKREARPSGSDSARVNGLLWQSVAVRNRSCIVRRDPPPYPPPATAEVAELGAANAGGGEIFTGGHEDARIRHAAAAAPERSKRGNGLG